MRAVKGGLLKMKGLLETVVEGMSVWPSWGREELAGGEDA